MSTNRFCALMGVERPLQQASMTRVTTPALVAAVGQCRCARHDRRRPHPGRPGAAQLKEICAQTSRPIGAGSIVRFLDSATLEAVADRVPIIELFYGWPDPSLVLPGTVTGWQVGSLDEAKAAVDAGCRFVVAQGVEAGGHVRSTTPLGRLANVVASNPAIHAALLDVVNFRRS